MSRSVFPANIVGQTWVSHCCVHRASSKPSSPFASTMPSKQENRRVSFSFFHMETKNLLKWSECVCVYILGKYMYMQGYKMYINIWNFYKSISASFLFSRFLFISTSRQIFFFIPATTNPSSSPTSHHNHYPTYKIFVVTERVPNRRSTWHDVQDS